MYGAGLNTPAIPPRRMRKGTRSCTECRRRKIRCIVSHGASICSNCSARGSQCIDQREDINTTPQEASNTTRARDTYIETQDSPFEDETSDVVGSISGIDHQAPLVSLLADTELWSVTVESSESSVHKAAQTPFSLSNSSEDMFRPTRKPGPPATLSRFTERKTKAVCETLRTALPSFDSIMATLSKNGGWWDSFRQKTYAISQKPVGDLGTFAARAYTSSNPAELGILAAAYARSLDKGHQLYSIVDSLVISDLAYVATIEGMECLILLAKAYTDIGQPRRAWLMWRRGMAIAQLMGFHRQGADLVRQTIWWVVYHGDRFTSLLLGLPHGFNDGYYGSVEAIAGGPGPLEHRFVLRCAILAGQVIDRNIMPGNPTLARTLDLDEKMDTIAASMPEIWWETPNQLPDTNAELDILRERLLQQFYFFHVRSYLHLPFMASSASVFASNTSRLACLEAARQMLKRFLLLRADIHGTCLFECKTSDFVAFTAAVILALGLDGPDHMPRPSNPDEDMRLLETTGEVFRKEEQEKGCKISTQCRKALGILMRNPAQDHQSTTLIDEPRLVLIPYFGTVVRRQGGRLSVQQEGSQAPRIGDLPNHVLQSASKQQSSVSHVADSQTVELHSQVFEYSGYSLPNPIMANGDVGWDSFSSMNATGHDPSSWLDGAMMDLDQDWSSFSDMYSAPFGTM